MGMVDVGNGGEGGVFFSHHGPGPSLFGQLKRYFWEREAYRWSGCAQNFEGGVVSHHGPEPSFVELGRRLVLCPYVVEVPRQSVGGGESTQKRQCWRSPLLKTTALRGN